MRRKLVVVAIAALAPVVAMLGYNEYAMRQQRTEEVRAQAAEAARLASSEVERVVEGLRSLLTAVATMPSVRHLDVRTCNEALEALAGKVPNIRTIFVLNRDGKLICGSVEMPAGTSFADRDYFKKAIETKEFVVGGYTKSRISSDPVLPVATPILDGDAVTGVVVTGIRLDWLQNRITERGVAPGNAVALADGTGIIVARVPSPERFVGTLIPERYRKLVHAEQPGIIDIVSQDGTRRILGYRPVGGSNPLYVSAGVSTKEAFAPINRSTINNSIGIAVGALIALVLAVFIGDRFLVAPVASILNVVNLWRGGDIGSRTGMNSGDEIHSVGEALDGLLDELERRRIQNEAAEEERNLLVQELAHRVKNGFALVQAIAWQTFSKSDPERYRSYSERLAALASTYDLILTKEGSASTVQSVVVAALQAHIAEAGRVSMQGPDILLPPHLALPLSLVVHELATNATKYGSLSTDDGIISIRWTTIGGELQLTWTETGGPPVVVPSRKGFGSVLIERAFPTNARARSRPDYRIEGLVFEIAFLAEPENAALSQVHAAPAFRLSAT